MIASYQEAQFLYATCEAERCEREIALQVAQAGLQQAKQKFQYARKKLTNAEFRWGRTRYMIKKGGFSDILHQKSYGVNVRRRPLVRVHRAYIPSYHRSFSQPILRQSLNHDTWSSLCSQVGLNNVM